jgi:hypothetical protein
MARRNKTPPPVEVRVSHETTRRSEAWLAAAFECVVPVVEREVGAQPTRRQDLGAAVLPRCAKSIVRG